MLKAFVQDDNGFIVSAELVLVLTIAVLAMVVGLSEVASAVNTELNDISNAIGSLNQSIGYTGFSGSDGTKVKAFSAGASWHDSVDDCDLNTSCNIVIGVTAGATTTEACNGF
jgi:Flp pilus assembly pilin Flp